MASHTRGSRTPGTTPSTAPLATSLAARSSAASVFLRKTVAALGLVIVAMLGVPASAFAASVDCGATQSFGNGLGGWGPWWSGRAPAVANVGRTDSRSMRLAGNPGTASRIIQNTECAFATGGLSFYARTASGSARVAVKLVDDASGAVIYDSANAPVTVGTSWTRITVAAPINAATLIGINAQSTNARSVTAYIDDVVLANDACALQSFASDLGGWGLWWSGDAPALAVSGRSDAASMRLAGPTFGTATRNVSATECAQPIRGIAYYARAEVGSAWVYTKLVDVASGAVLFDSALTSPVSVSSDRWTPITVNVPIDRETLVGVSVQAQNGGAVGVLIDDVMVGPGTRADTTQPDNVPVPDRSGQGWALAWADDFSAAALDGNKWAAVTTGNGDPYATSTEGFGDTFGLECFVGSQVAVQGGALRLTAQPQATRCRNEDRVWASGLVLSKSRFAQAFGRFEARMKFPAARGSWPAFWLLPAQQATTYPMCPYGWPCTGEIDVLEYVGRINPATGTLDTTTVYQTTHWGNAEGADPGNAYGASYSVQPSVDRWTVYAVEWDATGLSYYVDAVLVKKLAFPLPATTIYSGGAPFNVPFYLILNQSVGGAWAGLPDASAYPNTVQVDYVAVYRKP